MINEINKVVDDYISKNISSSLKDSEKLKLVHDFIIDNTKYDKLKVDNIDDETYNSENAYGVLIEHYGICSGYADTMAIFLNKLGIINYKISNDEHIWNLAYVDNKWVHIDLTWDDPVTDTNENVLLDEFFLISNNKLVSKNTKQHNYDINIYKEIANH